MIAVAFFLPDRREVNMRLSVIPPVGDRVVLFGAIFRVVSVTWEFDAPGLQADDPRRPVVEPVLSVHLGSIL